MTTNHPGRLDPALIRPGRADVHVELGLVCADTAARLFARFFPGEPGLAAAFRENLAGLRFTPAEVQGWLLSHAADPVMAAAARGLAGRRLAAGASG
jgi:chaperone BCS1